MEKSGLSVSAFYQTGIHLLLRQSTPVDARTCKHLKALLGDKYEEERLKLMNPNGPAPPTSKKKPGSKAAASKKVPELLLANKWDLETGPDPTGWWISEKLDGVRFV
jgi:DNA ligase-1